ncbi:MAG TPA: hypothetical protein VGP22_07920 [Albitalea sp.]|nr:hypothetical protein [Albitalea sp.]
MKATVDAPAPVCAAARADGIFAEAVEDLPTCGRPAETRFSSKSLFKLVVS